MFKQVVGNWVLIKAFLYIDGLHTAWGVAQERRRREEPFKQGAGRMVRDQDAQDGQAPSTAGSRLSG